MEPAMLHRPVCVLRCAFKWELLVYTLLQPSKSHLWILLFLESGDSDLRGRRMLSILKGDMELQCGVGWEVRGGQETRVKPLLCSSSTYKSTYHWLKSDNKHVLSPAVSQKHPDIFLRVVPSYSMLVHLF